MPTSRPQLARNIASERVRLGVNQCELAKMLDTSRVNVSHWERGANVPNAKYIIRMCKVFNCSADYLLDLTDERTCNGHRS